jgi:phenylacetaldehyde dehydrogenase
MDPSEMTSASCSPVAHVALASPETRGFIAQPPHLHIAGVTERWTGATLETIDPSTGNTLGVVAQADAAAVDRAVAVARATLRDPGYRDLTPVARERMLFRLAELMERDAAVLAELDSLEMGKPLAVSRGIVGAAATFVRYMAGWATKIHGRTFTPSPRQPGLVIHGYTLREPVGVAACIIPWNVAVLMAAWKIAPALATGCTVILKPAEGTSHSALKLAQLVAEAGFPAGALSVLPGRGAVTGQLLVDHPGVDKIAFTGSTAVGLRIAASAGGRMARTTMELGGKSPFLVLPDADMETTARAAAHAAFYNTGQICGAGTRLIVPRLRMTEFADRILELATEYRPGRALDQGTDFGPAASRAQYDKAHRLIGVAADEGGEVLAAPIALPNSGFFLAPHLIIDARPHHTIFREEVFGPVLAVTPYDEFEEAIALCNDSEYGLAAGVWGKDARTIRRAIREIRAGTVWVNCYHVYDPTMPFGGVGRSGIGRELGEEVLDNFLETKTVAEAC